MGKLITGLIVLAFVALIWSLIRWEYRECRSVGHSALYCAVKAGRR